MKAKEFTIWTATPLRNCSCIAANPKLLLLDEPAAGMNPQETHELMELNCLYS